MAELMTKHQKAKSNLDDLVGYNLKRAYVVVQADFRRALDQDNLSARLFSTLSLVAENPDISQSAVARRLGIERSGVVSMIDDLEKRGFVVRKPVPGDRRVQALQATPDGNTAYQAALEIVKDHEASLLSDLSAEERQMLISILKKIRLQET